MVFPHPDGPTMAVKVLGEKIPDTLFRMVFCTFCMAEIPLGPFVFSWTVATTLTSWNLSSKGCTGVSLKVGVCYSVIMIIV